MRHELDATLGAWHLGAIDATGQVVATSSFYAVPCPLRPEALPAVRLQFMAVDPMLQDRGIGSAVMAEAIRRLKATGAAVLWATARDTALAFYGRFGFIVLEGSAYIAESGRPHHMILLEL